MIQLFAVVAAILCIPLLTKINLSVGPALMLLGVLAGVLGRLSLHTIGQAFLDVFLVPSALSSVLVVIEIGMLSTLMGHYGLLKRRELAMRRLLPNPRLIMMLMPAMVGALQAPGGAARSAAFTNHLGTEIGLTPAQRSNINVLSLQGASPTHLCLKERPAHIIIRFSGSLYPLTSTCSVACLLPQGHFNKFCNAASEVSASCPFVPCSAAERNGHNYESILRRRRRFRQG